MATKTAVLNPELKANRAIVNNGKEVPFGWLFHPADADLNWSARDILKQEHRGLISFTNQADKDKVTKAYEASLK
jgi:hypothetical protein